jgi:NADPH:quinone reductase-like Zn-dependent oxidoreductase
MRAVICPRGGPPEVLELREVEKPPPGPKEILIRIHASTVTSGDVILRKVRGPVRWVFSLAFGLGKNPITGHELSGDIEKVGSEVMSFQAGEAVFASTGNKGGANAEFICLPEDGMIATKPANLNYEQAAAVPVGANTALVILREGAIKAGMKVLVYGASGSVGTYAVQLARHFGAEVSGVCSTGNLDLVRSLGASRAIDYTQEDFTETGERYDVVFDAVGKVSESECKQTLTDGGVFLSVRSSTKERQEDLVVLKELLEAGAIRPVIDRMYGLEDIVEAHRYVELGHKRGNVVLTVN